MKQIINGITYNTETAELIAESAFKRHLAGQGGRELYKGKRGKSKGEYFIAEWHYPYHTYTGIKEIEKEDINSYIWDWTKEDNA